MVSHALRMRKAPGSNPGTSTIFFLFAPPALTNSNTARQLTCHRVSAFELCRVEMEENERLGFVDPLKVL